jgi:hypothetical protein
MTVRSPSVLTQAEIARRIRASLSSHYCDETGAPPRAAAIYTLSDPRDLRQPHYVGQTLSPRRRFLQHLHAARLWWPDETPWWIRTLRHRPLYEWIRSLYRDGGRLPVMIVCEWVDTPSEARSAERALVLHYVRRGLVLLNAEARVLGPQIPLL